MFEIMNIGLHFTKPTKVLKKPEISQINKSYECFIVDHVTIYSYIKTNMRLIYKNAFKRCINTCTFHDNLLFLVCSLDALSQILEYLLIYMFYLFFCLYVYFRLRSYAWSGYLEVWQRHKNERASVETIRILHGREVR